MSFSSVTIEGKKAAPDRIYYNGTVINNTLLSTQLEPDPAVVFQDQRQNPIVPDASNYELSVQNFSLNGCPKTLPLFIPQICPALLEYGPGFPAGAGPGLVQLYTASVNEPPNQDIGLYQTLTYTMSNTLSPGNYVQSVGGFTKDFFNFNTPQRVIASDGNTFTIEATNIPIAFGGESTVLGTASYYDPTDVTTTIYTVSVGAYDGTLYGVKTAPIIWVPENQAKYTVVPKTASPVQIESDYYYCYTYTHWVRLINAALNTAWTDLGNFLTFGTQCPFIEYDETTGLFSLNQDSNTTLVPYGDALPQPYNVTSTSTSASGGTYQAGEYSFVGMNSCLENLLSNFPAVYFGSGQTFSSGGPSLPEVVIDTGLPIDLVTGGASTDSPVGNTLRTQPRTSIFQLVNPFTGTAIANAFFARLPQDYVSTGGCWSPIASFVLVTSQIPVRNEATANPITFGIGNVGGRSLGNLGGQTENGGAFQKVLIETPIESITADIWKGFVLYEPKTLTFSSLDPSHDGVSDIDVKLCWRNRLTNSLIPVEIPNQGSMSFRLLFKRKLAM